MNRIVYILILMVMFTAFAIILIEIDSTIPVIPETTESTQLTENIEVQEHSEIISLGTFTVTAYCPCEQCCDTYGVNRPTDKDGKEIVYTASGTVAQQERTVAVDPNVIPYGTELLIKNDDGLFVPYIAEDCGGAIKDKRIDIYFDTHEEALQFGVQQKEIFIVVNK